MTNRNARWPTRPVFVAVLLALLLGGGVGYFVTRNSEGVGEAKRQAEAIRASQVEACEQSKEPPGGVRYVIAQQIREEIQQSRMLPPEFFPNIPLETFKQLVRERNAQRRAQIHALLDVDCEAVPASPSSA